MVQGSGVPLLAVRLHAWKGKDRKALLKIAKETFCYCLFLVGFGTEEINHFYFRKKKTETKQNYSELLSMFLAFHVQHS